MLIYIYRCLFILNFISQQILSNQNQKGNRREKMRKFNLKINKKVYNENKKDICLNGKI